MKALGAAAAIAALSLACASARRSEPFAQPFVPASPEIARGEMAYMRYCNQCHTQGESSFAPALNNKPAPGWLIKFQVRHGLGAMPRFTRDQISPRDLDAIVRYMKAVRRQKPLAAATSATSAK